MNKIFSSKIVAVTATAGLALGAFIGLAGPASAATSGGTIATFSITGGALSITVPASTVALATGTVATGAASASAQLGTVSVNDARAQLVNSWTTTVTSTSFTTGTAAPGEVVLATSIGYNSGLSTATSGLGAFVPSGALPSIGAGVTGASWAGLAGNDTASWNPTLTFTLAPSQVAGLYSGTVTHSVA
ncbi:MAG TPA: hypothetical protein VHT75_19600 [Acidimicrobiales bacterium]|nr:hypothetical protein [Acidimicrobiales bacterium]